MRRARKQKSSTVHVEAPTVHVVVECNHSPSDAIFGRIASAHPKITRAILAASGYAAAAFPVLWICGSSLAELMGQDDAFIWGAARLPVEGSILWSLVMLFTFGPIGVRAHRSKHNPSELATTARIAWNASLLISLSLVVVFMLSSKGSLQICGILMIPSVFCMGAPVAVLAAWSMVGPLRDR